MAGINQHHIPQSLQRGFLFNVKAEQTNVHRRDGNTFPASIKNVAVQRYFYSRLSEDGSKTLDDQITDYENRLNELLVRLRSVPIDGAVDVRVAAEAIAHLTPRCANVRRIFGSSMEQLLRATAEVFSDEDSLMRMLGLAEPEPNPTWNGHIVPILDEEPQIKIILESLCFPKSLLDRMIFVAAKEHFVGSFDAKTWGITAGFATLLDRLDEMVRDSHNKTLSQGLIPELRKTSLEALEWHIRAAPPEGAILPDCVALGLDEEGEQFLPYMMTGTNAVFAVVMPITSEKLLVGVRPGRETPNLADFNRDAAACSDELFIAASQARLFDELRANMGACWMAEMDGIVQSALNTVFSNKSHVKTGGGEVPPLSPVDYQLAFAGFDTEEEVGRISEVTKSLISQLQRLFDLERLDGITFAANYQGALNDLERGFDVNVTPEGVPDHIAHGAATALVLRDGVAKVRIVMHSAYGQSLIADEQQNAEVALHFLVAGLAQACTLSRIEK
ncbi:MAG: hypothetical protein RLO21_16340, partial [Nitratireductor sp.]